jgi:ABC-type nitrate/sulfonate/bicarbonate transport system substrate-binding protein
MSGYLKNIFYSVYSNEQNNEKNTESLEKNLKVVKETWGWFVDPEEAVKQSNRQPKRESTVIVKKISKTQSNDELSTRR